MRPGDSGEGGGFTGPVCSDEGDEFTLLDPQVHAFERGDGTVPRVEIGHFKKTQGVLRGCDDCAVLLSGFVRALASEIGFDDGWVAAHLLRSALRNGFSLI